MNTPNTPDAPKVGTAKKPDMVTIALTVSYPAKENMTIADLTAEGQKALKLFDQAKNIGDVTGYVQLGNRKFALKEK